ncbi:MAG: ATP-binding cassette domain-containing protein, partial [Clostridia bacterium]|nr:ATP-binding cassette domain-containing protein [Clostridia bacterium]
MILIKNLYLRYIREYFALYDINLKIEQNESVAFLGEVESGKTSLLRILAKVEKYTKGEVYIKNIPLQKINYATDVNLGYIPATPVFFENKTVYDNLKYVLKVQKIKKTELETKINDALIEFKLENIKDTKIKALTLFEKYLISFARLSFRMLEIVLIDDIFENLKQEEQEVLKEIIKKNYVGKSIL